MPRQGEGDHISEDFRAQGLGASSRFVSEVGFKRKSVCLVKAGVASNCDSLFEGLSAGFSIGHCKDLRVGMVLAV